MADQHDKERKAAGLFDSALAAQVRESAQQIWLAGMGAFAKAQAEGKQVFEALVKEGATLQNRTHQEAGDRFAEMASRMQSMAADAGSRAGQQWDKLESIFEERTAKALKRLGVPSARDIEALAARLDALAAKIDALAPAGGAAKTRAGTKRAARGPTPHHVAAKKTARPRTR
ncbi:MAG TPA: phasin family protein [Caldimonas sp.]|nr:phasin family protein [Caldimonas sp.]